MCCALHRCWRWRRAAACGERCRSRRASAAASRRAQAFAAEQQTWRDAAHGRADRSPTAGPAWSACTGSTGRALRRQRRRQRHPPGDGPGAPRHARRARTAAALRAGDGRRADPRRPAAARARPRCSTRRRRARPEHARLRQRQGHRHGDQARRPLRVARQACRCAARAPASRASSTGRSSRDWKVDGTLHRRIRRARRFRSSTSSASSSEVPNPGVVEFERDGKTLPPRSAGRRRRHAVPDLRRPHQRPRQLRRRPLPLRAEARCAAARWCSTSTRPTTRRARSPRTRPARCRRRKTASTWRSPPARRRYASLDGSETVMTTPAPRRWKSIVLPLLRCALLARRPCPR